MTTPIEQIISKLVNTQKSTWQELARSQQGIEHMSKETAHQIHTPIRNEIKKILGEDLYSVAQYWIATTDNGNMVCALNRPQIEKHETKYVICFNRYLTKMAVIDLDELATLNYMSLFKDYEHFIRGTTIEAKAKTQMYEKAFQVFKLAGPQMKSLFI